MTPRETECDGRLFRSRLEAKWACWFSAWGMEYEYEPERYGPGRLGYLPDFYLPALRRFWEIKPACQFQRTEAGVDRAWRAAKYMPQPLWIVYGEPLPGRYIIERLEGPQMVLAHCRRCHGLNYVLVQGKTIAEAWIDAESGGWGWGQIGAHVCGDHDRAPAVNAEDALAASYINGRNMWRWL